MHLYCLNWLNNSNNIPLMLGIHINIFSIFYVVVLIWGERMEISSELGILLKTWVVWCFGAIIKLMIRIIRKLFSNPSQTWESIFVTLVYDWWKCNIHQYRTIYICTIVMHYYTVNELYLELKVIIHYRQYTARPACTSVLADQAL